MLRSASTRKSASCGVATRWFWLGRWAFKFEEIRSFGEAEASQGIHKTKNPMISDEPIGKFSFVDQPERSSFGGFQKAELSMQAR
jgi:hypothetical protein